MRSLIVFVLMLIGVYFIIQESIGQKIERARTPAPITEEQCYEKGGTWEFEEFVDRYGTDYSGYICIVD